MLDFQQKKYKIDPSSNALVMSRSCLKKQLSGQRTGWLVKRPLVTLLCSRLRETETHVRLNLSTALMWGLKKQEDEHSALFWLIYPSWYPAQVISEGLLVFPVLAVKNQ